MVRDNNNSNNHHQHDDDDDADNKNRNKGSFLASLRRSGFLRVPAASALMEEMRPMLSVSTAGTAAATSSNSAPPPSSTNAASGGKTSRSTTPTTLPRLGSTTGGHHHHHPHNPHHPYHHNTSSNFEISVRDKSDATAKRGFRVQVPKRMLLYTILVFLGMPLIIFMYMEMKHMQHTTTSTIATASHHTEQQRGKTHHTATTHATLSDVLHQEVDTANNATSTRDDGEEDEGALPEGKDSKDAAATTKGDETSQVVGTKTEDLTNSNNESDAATIQLKAGDGNNNNNKSLSEHAESNNEGGFHKKEKDRTQNETATGGEDEPTTVAAVADSLSDQPSSMERAKDDNSHKDKGILHGVVRRTSLRR